MSHSRCPTIGFLTANVHVGSTRSMWPGILDAAVQNNVNLINFPGGRLHSKEDFEAERNVIYQLVDTEELAGLVSWTSALAGALSTEELAAFFERYQPLPIVSLGSHIAEWAQVNINGYQGMQDLVFHLIDVHGYQQIALIRGPESHPYARERYQAYLDALEARDIAPDPRIVAPAMSWEKGAEAICCLLDERQLEPGRDFRAVVAVSDLQAISALRTLNERGYRVPTDVAVVGFNDVEEGQLIRPPLTSVSLPFYNQAQRAVQLLMDSVSGKETPTHVNLDSRLLVRRSCGCPSESVELATIGYTRREPPKSALDVQQHMVEHISRVIRNQGMASTWAKQLLDAFYKDLSTGSPYQFRTTLDGMLQRGDLYSDETAAWQIVISVLRRDILPTLDGQQIVSAESLFGQARVLIGEAIQLAQSARRLQIERQNSLLREIGQALLAVFDIDQLAKVLSERLPELGISCCYLALYDDSTAAARLVMAYRDNQQIDLDQSGRRYPSRHLIPAELLPDRRYSLVVEPLFFQAEPLGYIVFEVGPENGEVYEVLRGHISSAIKGAHLFNETHEARRRAEHADAIKTRLLANVSHELRTPLNIIIGHAQSILTDDMPVSDSMLETNLERIEQSAHHQLRIINDLLDLSRAEINALDLYPEKLDPQDLIRQAFSALADQASTSAVAWELQMPEKLPPIEADPVRLRQILLNLLSNSDKFTAQGRIVLGVETLPPHLHIWVEDTGIGVPEELQENIYEPFVTQGGATQSGGIGLGLSITKHLVHLHGGFMTLDSQPEVGSVFHVYLPLPEEYTPELTPEVTSCLWLISQRENVPEEIADFAARQGLEIVSFATHDELEAQLSASLPNVIAWDMTSTGGDSWSLIRRLHNHPQLNKTPIILYQPDLEETITTGLTSLVVKPVGNQALWEAVRPSIVDLRRGSILIIDDDEQACLRTQEAISQGLPDYEIRTAMNGHDGLTMMRDQPPSLVILDLMMPEMDGFEVLDRMRLDDHLRDIPVVILSGRQLSIHDIERLEQHADIVLHNKEMVTAAELVASLNKSLFGTESLPPQTSALVMRSIAYFHQHYGQAVSRSELAEHVGMNEDYLSRVFTQELGITPWEYLTRYRIIRAKDLLLRTEKSISQIGHQVGFSDPAYFSRVFRKHTGVSPREYRNNPID